MTSIVNSYKGIGPRNYMGDYNYTVAILYGTVQ